MTKISTLTGIPCHTAVADTDNQEESTCQLQITNQTDGAVLRTITGKDSILAYFAKFVTEDGVSNVDQLEELWNAETLPSAVQDLSLGDAGNDNALLANLAGVEYKVLQHEAIVTVEDLVSKVVLEEDGAVHTKNLFLKDKKHGLFLICLNGNDSADVSGGKVSKIIGPAIGLKGKVNLRMPDEALLEEVFGCQRGCLGGLCVSNIPDGTKVTIILDQALVENDAVKKVYSHPADNTLSVGISTDDFVAYVNSNASDCDVHVVDFSVDPSAAAPAAAAKNQQQQQQSSKKSSKKQVEAGKTLLALRWKKEEDFAQWYSDVIVLSELISYYDISGCYILLPWSYSIWECIQEFMNVRIKGDLKTKNCYFPLFVSKDRLEKEKDHVEGFAPEVAWVTKGGTSDLASPVAIRPTSETIMYPTFSNRIQSHRDLPLCLNQWSNVVRWEFKDPTPFLRSREFLWQEGHTAHADHEESSKMVMDALEMYRATYEDLLGVPVVPGYKTEKEKFAGGYRTTTVEAYIPCSGRAIQGATSHDLGQNFGKMFDIEFQTSSGGKETAWQTSWGFTTRSIGVMIMVHGDDKGLVLPPRVAPVQVVIVPIVSKACTYQEINPYCQEIANALTKDGSGIRVEVDDRTIYNPGWKYNHWEQKGVPIRIEVGPRDLKERSARIVVRYSGEKFDLSFDSNDESKFGEMISKKLEDIQAGLFAKAKEVRDSHIVQVTEWKDFVPALEGNNLVLTPWCGGEHQEWEEWVKEKSREESLAAKNMEGESETTATSVAAKTLCIPFKQPDLPAGSKCIASGLEATCWVLWGRSY